jgi:hypothetical protein
MYPQAAVALSPAGATPRHRNKHIDYGTCCAPIPNLENEKSLAQPLGMAVTSDGATLYVAAFGSSKIGVYSTAALEADTFVPSTANQIPVSDGPFLGDQVRGIGFNSDGSIPTMFLFNSGFDVHPDFNPIGIPLTPEGAQAKRDMEEFMLAFDSKRAGSEGQGGRERGGLPLLGERTVRG